MTDDRSLERAARSWLESGPTEAPDRAVEAALSRIQTTRQERDIRVPWRTRPMSTTARLAAAAIAIAIVVAGGALILRPGNGSTAGGPDPEPTSTPQTTTPVPSSTPVATASTVPSASAHLIPTMAQTFTSTRHGYSIRYPTGWTASPATKRWTGLDGPDPGAGNMDVLHGPGFRLVAESAPLGKQTPAGWRDAYAARFGLDGVGVCDVLPKDQPRITIGSVQGYLDGNDCPGDATIAPGDRFFEALAFVDGRVYLFWLQGTIDRAYFDAMLQTVVFDARHANDKP